MGNTIQDLIEENLAAARKQVAEVRKTSSVPTTKKDKPAEKPIVTVKTTTKAKTVTNINVKKKNIPIVEVTEHMAKRARGTKLARPRAEKLFDFYAKNFSKIAPTWISFGISSLLEKGVVDAPTDSLLISGFCSQEEDKIHEQIDPENTFCVEAINAESNLKIRVAKDLIAERAGEISDDELRNAKHDGLLRAISSGAHKDSKSEKIFYSIPFGQGDEVVKFMKENGVDPDSKKVRNMSYNGFIGIVEAIKNDKKAAKEGFVALDWYFDTFNYKEYMDEFIDAVDAYQEFADRLFGDKLDEYFARKKEFEEWQKQQPEKQGEIIVALADAENVAYEKIIDFLKENTSSTKNAKIMEELEKIRGIDLGASYAIGANYALIRFGNNGFNNVVAVHIGNGSKAVFCWRGKTGDNTDGWRDYFRNNDAGVKKITSRGCEKKGFLTLDDQWAKVWDYLNSPS